MQLLVFGRSGQVASELARRLPDGLSARFLDRDAADLSDPAACAAAIAGTPADAVINAAAFTAVDRAEAEPDLAQAVNAEAPAAMARACADRAVPFVQVSTDYVFGGQGTRPFAPDDATAPRNVYGRTKRDGEAGLRAAGGRHAILRTSWVFSAHGSNFVKTMLRLGATRDRLTVVADQIGGPTPAADIADALITIARALADGQAGGTYHFAGAPEVSWADFAREIFTQAKRDVEVVDIATADYPTPATRPANSRLDCRSLETDFGIKRPDWRAGLATVLAELEAVT